MNSRALPTEATELRLFVESSRIRTFLFLAVCLCPVAPTLVSGGAVSALEASTGPILLFTTLAGSPYKEGSVDGTGIGARFSSPRGLAVDDGGNVFVADSWNHTVRKVAPDGTVTTFAGEAGVAGNIDGVGTAARFSYPTALAIDAAGRIVVADSGNYAIRRIGPDGAVTTLATGFSGLAGIAADNLGNVFVIDVQFEDVGPPPIVKKIKPDGQILNVATLVYGNGWYGISSFTVDGFGNVLVTEPFVGRVQKVTPDGVVSTFSSGFATPNDVCVDSAGNVYVVNTGTHSIVMTDPAGNWIASMGNLGHGDGTDMSVKFSTPVGVTVDRAGNIYVSCTGSQTIRKGVPVVAENAEPASRLINASVRARMVPERPLIPGFFVKEGSKPMLVRAIGPGLESYLPDGVTFAADPRLEVFNGDGISAGVNDNWGGGATLRDAFASVGAFPLDALSFDAARLQTVSGAQTVHVHSTTSGVGLVELYDADRGAASRLGNFSARYEVGGGAGVLVLGFVIEGTGEKTVLIRGVGPGIAAAPHNILGTLENPKIEVFNGAQLKFAENDDWLNSLEPIALQVGAFSLPIGSSDAALMLTLQPGLYTAVLSGADGGSGEGLIEVYEVQ